MKNCNLIQNWQELFQELEQETGNDVVMRTAEGKTLHEITAPEFYRAVKQASNTLLKHGLENRHVGLIGPNSADWVIAFCALLNVGSVAVLLSADTTGEGIAELAEQTDLSALIYAPELEQNAMHEACTALDRINLSDLQDTDTARIDAYRSTRRRDDLACILFTSGTTGKNKAVMHTNATLIENFCHPLIKDDFRSLLSILPYHHIAGFGLVLLALCRRYILCIGSDMKKIYRDLEIMKPEAMCAVPILMDIIGKKLRHVESVEQLGWRLKVISCGGAKFMPEQLGVFLDKGIHIWQCYGSSESGGRGLFSLMHRNNLDALGYPSELEEAKLVDGELVMRGSSFAVGYYKNEIETQESFRDGWFYTGDICRVDENGCYYLVGRKKNLIILSNGENISPEEIEEKMMSCPDIAEIVVFEKNDFLAVEVYPVYNETCGQTERTDIHNRIDEFIRQYNKKAVSYKRIMYTLFRDEPFPRTSTGKIVRA